MSQKKLRKNRTKKSTPQEEFTGKNLTRFGGAGLIRRFFDKINIRDYLQEVGTDKRREIDFSPFEFCFSMLNAMMLGVFRPFHMLELKADTVFQKLIGLDRFPSQSAISRFLAKITVHKAEKVADINFRLLKKIRKNLDEFDGITLDLDSHVISVFGSQHRAKKGYNPKKPGRLSFHPLMCFIGETRDYIGGFLRPGNRHSAYKARDLLNSILKNLPKGKVKRLRADSGFFSFDFLAWLIRRQIEFYIAVPQHIWVQKFIRGISEWREIGKDLSVGEFRLDYLSILQDVRFVVIRELVPAEEKPRKQLTMFKNDEVRYNYQVIATTASAIEEEVWREYNKRACCENFIKESIYGFGLDKSITKHWAGAKLYFELVMLAYNLMNWFKEKALGHKDTKEMVGTIRMKLLWIPGKLVNSSRKLKIKLADSWSYKEEFNKALEAFS